MSYTHRALPRAHPTCASAPKNRSSSQLVSTASPPLQLSSDRSSLVFEPQIPLLLGPLPSHKHSKPIA
jgi:hypothetical protein